MDEELNNELTPRLKENSQELMDQDSASRAYLEGVVSNFAEQAQGGSLNTSAISPKGQIDMASATKLSSGNARDANGEWLRPPTNEDLEELAKTGNEVTFSDAFKRNTFKNPTNLFSAAGAGVVDTATDTINLIPGINIPKLPEYEDGVLQGIREISGLVIPSMYLSKYLKFLGIGAHAKVNWAVGNNALVKFTSKAGIDAFAGGLVDRVSTLNLTDHNAAGSLKAAWPETYGWIPDNIATLDSDSPETKRMKNINEGVGLSFFGDIFLGGTKILRELKGIDEATQWVPKSEKAKYWLAEVKRKALSTDAVENEILVNSKKRVDQFTEMGKYNLSITEDIDLDKPIKGVHDIYDMYETGFRTADDGGIVFAQYDAVRIAKGIDSVQGRVGSVFTDSALKKGLNLDDAGHGTMKELSKDLQLDVEWHGQTGKIITKKEAISVGEDLAAALYDMEVDEMKRVVDGFLTGVDPDTGIKVLNTEGYVGVFNAIKRYFDDYMNMDLARAQAYTSESLAGQVSDMAEASRLMSDAPLAVQRAQEQVLDRLQYLMNIKAQTSYARGRALNMINIFQRIKTLDFRKKGPAGKGKKSLFNNALAYIENEKEETIKNLKKITKESRDTIDLIRTLNKEKPSMLKPLMLTYEATDGNVNTISKLNRWFKESTGLWKKAIIDINPDMPSMLVQGAWSNIYNSTLSAIGTPLKAGASNLALMIERPIATFAGALGNPALMRRAMYMYTVGMQDTLSKATKHMNFVYRQASRDPTSVQYVMRKDFQIKNQKTLTALNSIADAKDAEGLAGPKAMMMRINDLNDLAENPVLRFGANSMTAFDGFTRSFIASVDARGRAYDTLLAGNKKITNKSIKKAGNEVYKEMFDDTGMITDKGVEHASKEIAMNLDNPAVDGLNELMKYLPGLRPFLMFPRTAINMLRYTGTHTEMARFVSGLNDFNKPFHEMAISDVERLLKDRGLEYAGRNMEAVYETVRAELKGRRAIGNITVGTAFVAFSMGNLHGNGHYDPTRQQTRRQLNWQPRSFKGLDGKWYSYDGLGAISDWLALTADIMDNFDTLEENDVEVLMNKAGFLLSANLTNKSFLSGLEPLNDMLAGNPSAIARWTTAFGSSALPLSGFRNEFSRLLTPQLKEVEQEFTQLLANRNPIAKEGLPDAYDWVDGSLIRYPDNFFTRLWNAYSPTFKRSDSISPIKQFLIDIEFDGRPQLNTNGLGVEYSPAQRSEVTRLMGEEKLFARRVEKIMNSPAGKDFLRKFKIAQASGANLDRKEFIGLHRLVSRALRDSQKLAENRISEKAAVNKKVYYNNAIKDAERRGDVEEIIRLQKLARRI